MARMSDIEAGLEFAYHKAVVEHGRGEVSREDLLVAGRGLGQADIDTDLDRVLHTPLNQAPDVILVHSQPLRRKGGSQ